MKIRPFSYPPSQKTTGVSPWMNVTVGPAVALAKVGASADSAEEMKDTTGVNPWRLHSFPKNTDAGAAPVRTWGSFLSWPAIAFRE